MSLNSESLRTMQHVVFYNRKPSKLVAPLFYVYFVIKQFSYNDIPSIFSRSVIFMFGYKYTFPSFFQTDAFYRASSVNGKNAVCAFMGNQLISNKFYVVWVVFIRAHFKKNGLYWNRCVVRPSVSYFSAAIAPRELKFST
jgi:hypothetical protein